VHVVYLAAQESYRPADTPLAASFRTRYDLPKRYLLYLGGFDQRRNIHTLLEAFRHVLDCLQQSRKGSLPRLVLAGSLPEEDDIFTLDPRRMIEELGLAPWARCLGRIPEADKLPLYQGAEIFVFPSVYEGFGLPPLEAMACGTPVIAADATSLPEIVGDGGLLVPPRDVGAWSEAIYTLWLDKEARTALRIKALSQAAKFSWEKTARETWEIYRRVADTAIADSSQI
jgi:glycosyltransferase involved in cell wall biosynthesis